MKDIFLSLMLLLIFILLCLRINIQFSSIKELKENNILRKFGVDDILFFIPEFTPINFFRKELGNDITEKIEIYFNRSKFEFLLNKNIWKKPLGCIINKMK